MNRYDWVMWAFRLLFSSEVIQNVRTMVLQFEQSDVKGIDKREFIVNELKPMIGDIAIFFLRSLIEFVLGTIRTQSNGR